MTPDKEKKSNLTETALLVNPHLKVTYAAMREERVEEREALKDEIPAGTEGAEALREMSPTLISLANKITREEATDSDKVDFRIHLAEVKSRILSDANVDERGKTIRSNFVRKLETSVLGLG